MLRGIYRNGLLRMAVGLLLVFVSSAGVQSHSPAILSVPRPAECTVWADSVMSTLTLRQRVAQLFVPRFDITDNAAGYALLQKMVAREGIGGFLLGKGTVKSYTALIDSAQSLAEIPLLITLDGEWGPAMRVTNAPRFPYNMGLGAIQNPQLLYDYGSEVARECRLLGINVDFAPVLDVNSNPRNPVIGYRSFGEDAAHVARLGAAYCAGMEHGGVMSVGKHFPGHGDTSSDSHKTLPTVDHPRAMLDSVDLLPFRAAMDAGMSGIMVGHLKVPSLDAKGTPASLSNKITTGLLKHELGFKGLVFTDALAMKGASVQENNCVAALRAGADVLLGSSAPLSDMEAVVQAVKSGRIKQSDIDERCRKVLEYKCRLGYLRPDKDARNKICSNESEGVIDRLAKGMITVVRNNQNLQPVGDLSRNRIALVNIGAKADNVFADVCRRYAKVDCYSVDKTGVSQNVLHGVSDADIVILGVFSDAAWAVSAFNTLCGKGKEIIPVFFINPYKMSKFGNLESQHTLVAAYDNIPAVERAAAQALFGGIDVTGRFPVNVSGVASIGDGVDIGKCRIGYSALGEEGFDAELEMRVDSIVRACISGKAFPGCQVLVARNGNVVLDKAYGKLDYANDAGRVTSETIYDLASMTKATATVAGVMKAYDEGLIELDTSIAEYIPELQGTDKEDITVSDLLYHQSGLPATLDMYRLMTDSTSYTAPLFRRKYSAPYTVKVEDGLYAHRDARLRRDIISTNKSDYFNTDIAKGLYVCDSAYNVVMDAIYGIPLRDRKYLYSCLNFCLLMNIEENVTGVAHDQWVDTEVFAPIGAWHTGYRPLSYYRLADIPPTEHDRFLRKQHLRGYVHDEIAAFSGGVQGNAGLFGNAGDIAKLCQMWLDGGVYGRDTIYDYETVRRFIDSVDHDCMRGLGFDMLARQKSMWVPEASKRTFGHTGFTGTCFWVDPERRLIFVFLCNRITPSRNNKAFSTLNPRGAILSEIYKAMER